MEKVMIVTDLTRMHGNRVCVAGYLRDGTCVRPVLPHGSLTEPWLYKRGEVAVRPFARIGLDFLRPDPDPPHTEDWIIDPEHLRPEGMVKPELRPGLLETIAGDSVEEIFGATVHRDYGCYVRKGEGSRSLGTVQHVSVGGVWHEQKSYGKWDYRMTFTDQTGSSFRLAITDMALRCCLDYEREQEGMPPDEAAKGVTRKLRASDVYLRIGLARGWDEYPDRCYLQVTGIYSFPDYLDGRCFADFLTVQPKPVREVVLVGDADDIPF